MTYAQMKNLLSLTDDAAQKLELIMDFGAHMENVPENALCSEIVGCSSFVEICRLGDKFYGRADSVLVRGIVTAPPSCGPPMYTWRVLTSTVAGSSPPC